MTKSASKETSTRSSGGHFLSGAEPVDEAVDDACRRAVDDDGPRDREHLGGHACHKALWLCQDRHTVFSEFFQLPPKWGALIVLACRYKFKPARSTHIYLNLS